MGTPSPSSMLSLSSHITALVRLVVVASAAVTGPDELGFTPGLTTPAECRMSPSLNVCPAQLKSGNALVTSINVVNSQTGSTKRPPNILYAGFREDFVMGKLMEYATIAVFNFPAGHAARQCRFQLVSDAGDNVGGKPDIYNVFALKPHVGGISPNATTWFNRPERGVALATFTLDYRRIVESTANGKSLHGFLFGPGGAASAETLGKPFACPPVAGQIAYEVAGAVRNKGAGGAMNIGGHSGLGIEIIGFKSQW